MESLTPEDRIPRNFFGVLKIGKRSKFEIISEMLKICIEGARKTEIVYRANLNFKMLNEYLAELKRCGFTEERNGLIYTTDKGRIFIEKLDEALQLITH